MSLPPRSPPARLLAAAALTLALSGRAAAAPGPAAPIEVIRISGTGSALGVAARLAEAFELANPGLRVRLLPSVGSSGAIRAVAGGALELGLSGRAVRPEELALGLVAHDLARTPFVLATSPRTGVTGVGAAEAARLYRGELPNWPNGERVRVVLRPASDADTLDLRAISPEMAAAVDQALARPGMLMAATNQECNALLARTPGTIGPSTLAQLTTEPLGLVALAWEGVAPTLANLRAGRYPFAKPIVAVLPLRPTAGAARFLAFARSPEGRAILEAAGCDPAAPSGG